MSTSERLSPVVATVALTANIEGSIALPNQTKHFSLQARGSNDVKLAFSAGGTATTYATIKSGGAYTTPEKLEVGGVVTLYLLCASNETVEVIHWR